MTVVLQQITFETVKAVMALRVAENQRHHIASNADSIAEGHFNTGAWFRLIHADEALVGFVMLFDPRAPGAISRGAVEPTDVGLWRLMMDRRHQRKGYGRAALDRVCRHAREQMRGARLISSYVPGEHRPERFYLSYSFTKTGRMRAKDTEVEIVLPL